MDFLKSIFHLFPSFSSLYHTLNPKQQRNFTQSLAKKSLEQWTFYAKLLQKPDVKPANTQAWQPPSYFSLNTNTEEKEASLVSLKYLGESCFKKKQVAMLTVAGGLGTRLNFHAPKGLLPVTPIKHKPLFQVFAEKLKAIQKHYGSPLHWLIMTSEETDFATREAFKKQHWYDENYLHFFKQGTVPVFKADGTCAIQADGQLCYHPDGHGGVFHAMQQAGLLQALQSWGITTLSYFQVDNPLVYLEDKLFLGLHLQQQSEFSTKIVQKRSPEERVGVFVQKEDQLELVEYCDFPATLASAQDCQGQLKYRCGNTAIHLISVAFLQNHTEISLPLHVVQKKITTWDPMQQKEVETLGYKLEKFIFDALPYAHHPILLEIAREEEFSPVKNASGADSLASCMKDQYQRWRRWLQKKYKNSKNTLDLPYEEIKNVRIEISPLFSDCWEDFSTVWDGLKKTPKIQDGLYLGEHDERTF